MLLFDRKFQMTICLLKFQPCRHLELHKFVSEYLQKYNLEYRTGVIYTTNRRVWEWDEKFKDYLRKLTVIGIDMKQQLFL